MHNPQCQLDRKRDSRKLERENEAFAKPQRTDGWREGEALWHTRKVQRVGSKGNGDKRAGRESRFRKIRKCDGTLSKRFVMSAAVDRRGMRGFEAEWCGSGVFPRAVAIILAGKNA